MLARRTILTAVALCLSAVSPLLAETRLVMVEQHGCVYCQRWDREVGDAYDKTAEGRFAPLLRADIKDGPPEGFSYARRVNFTPTFILTEDGVEIGRIEGYPGEDFFWGLLGMMLTAKTGFDTNAS